MAKSFNLTAELNLRGPANLKTVVADIKRQLGTIGGNINVKIDPGAVKSIDGATRRIEALNSAIVKTRQNTNDLSASLRGLSSALGSVKSVGSVSAAGLKSTAESMNSAAKATQQATSRMEEFGKQSALAIKRFAAFSFVTTGIFALTNAITRGVKEFIEFDRQIVKLQQVTGKSRSGLTGLSDEITRLSTTLGVSSSSLIEVASTLAQAGLSAEDTKIALEALAKTELAPSFDDLTKTTEGAIAALRQFGLQTSQLESALGSINAVAAAFAVESSDIIAAIQRTGGVFAAASKGVSEGTDALNEFIAVFTSVRATTRESAETIATGLRTIFTRIQRAGTIEQLKAFGVELTDLEGKFVGPYEAVRRLSEALNQLDPRDIRFASIVEELGGFRQIGKVIPLIQQFATAQEALKVAQRGQDSLTAAQVTAQQSLANQLAKVREQFLALVRDIGQSSAFQNLFKIVTNLASGLISLVGAFKPILPLLSLLAVVKGVGAITKFGAGFAKGFGGKGAGETGRNIGETVSGTAAKERAEATSKAADAIRLNTDAIKNLTSSIQALDATIKSRGSTGLNSGGKVLAFARGGVVPGTGNRDTVPAMLQPGEFVIRKKAVETIGSNNLQKINKYASGGTVKDIASSAGVSQQLKSAVVNTKEEPFTRGTAVNANDKFTANIDRKPITDKMVQNDIKSKKINKKITKDLNSNDIKIKGRAFEEYLVKSGRTSLPSTRDVSEIYPVDFAGNNQYAEAKNVQQNINDSIYIDKLFRARTADKSYSGLQQTPTSAGNENINLGKLTVYERNFEKFAAGGKALGARSKFKELSQEEILQLSTPDLIAYGKALAQNIFTTGGAGMAIGSEFIEVPPERIVPELESSLVSYIGKRGFWRERVAPFGRPVAKTQKQLSKQDRQSALEAQVSKQADEVAARSQQWTSIRSGSDIDNYLLSTLSDPILSDYKRVRGGESLDKQFHNTRLRKAVNTALDSYDNFDYSAGNIDKLVSGMAAKRFAYGGLVQKFADGLEVESVGKISENIIRRLDQLGGPGPIKQAVGLDFINATIRQKLAGRKITAKDLLSPRSLRSIPDSASLLPALEPILQEAESKQKAKQTAKQEQIARNLQAQAGGAYRFGLASIFGPNGEFGYSDVSNAIEIEGKDGEKYLTQIIQKSLPKRYEAVIDKIRQSLMSVPQIAAEELQYVDIFGTGGPLAFDFDETLVKDADIPGKKFSDYTDLTKVEKALEGAKLTSLGKELQKRLVKYPQLLDNIRILTARPQNNASLLAATLKRLELPIPESKITGVSGGPNKVENLSDLETLIDDNLENIESVIGGGKRAIPYSEAKAVNLSDASSRKSISTMEGYALEEMVRSLGVYVSDDSADPGRPIDFPKGLGIHASKWDLPPTIPTDTKRTNSSGALRRLEEEAQRFYVQNFKLGGQVYDLQKGTGLSNTEFDQLVKYGNTNDFTHQEFKDYLANYLKNKASKKNLMMNTSQLRDVLLSGTRTPEPTAKQLALAQQLKPYAKGGSAEDTVPALLTPGEFVINKKAAQKIGYSQLAKLNKADKLSGYNRGGIVGGVQRFFVGGEAEKNVARAQGAVLSDIKQAEKTMAMILGSVTKDVRESITKLFKGIENVRAGGKTSLGTAFKDTTRGQVAMGTKKGQAVSVMGLQIGGKQVQATTETVAHETGHLADYALGGNKEYASAKAGTFQFELVEKVKPVMEKAFKESGVTSEQMLKYLTNNQELFAEFFAKASPEVQAIITSTTDAKIGMQKLKEHLEKAGHTYAGLEASDIDISGPSAAAGAGSGSPTSPTPSGTSATEAKAKADKLAAEQATYFAYKAKQAGFTVEEYQRKLARETTKLAKDIKLNLVGRQQDLKFTSVNLGADLKGRSRDGSDSDKTVIRQAEEVLIQKLQALNPDKAFQDIEKAASRLVDKLIESGGSFDDIKDSVDLVKESMDKTPESVDAVNEAMQITAKEVGISVEVLKNQIGQDVKARQNALKNFGANLNDVIKSFGGYIRVLGIGLTIATDQISKLIVSLDANSKLDADLMARLGGIQGGAQGLVAGQAIGSEGRKLLDKLFPNSGALGRRFEVFSTALGAIIGAINGAADAYNRAQLDKVLKGVSDSAKKVDIAFENLAKNNTPDAFNQAQKALAENAVAVSGLIDQANFGAGGPDRTRLEWMRGLDPTGITSSVTGQATEKEAREQLLTGVAELVNRARQLGDIRMSRVSGTEVEQSVKLAQDFDKKIADAVKTGNTGLATELRKQKTDQLAGTSQLFGQLRQTLATDNDAFLAIAAAQAARSGRTTPDQFSADMADPVKRNAAIEEGKRLSAMYAEQEQRSRLLADATRNIVIQTENLINIYGILDASLTRFSDAIDRIKNDAMDFADAYKGQASIKPVQRTDQDIFENIKAYSLDEVKGAAGRVSGLAGGGQVGADLERRIVSAKTIQQELPKILSGITAQNSGEAVKQLRDAFKENNIEVDPAVFNELAAKLESELTGKRAGATVAELAQDPAIMENLSKISEASLKAAANLSKTFYDTMDKAAAVTNEYTKALQEATEWQLKAADIRAKADMQLAEVLGENLSLDELNAPADARIRSLSTSSVLPGGSLDPNELYDSIEQLANQRQETNEEYKKQLMASIAATTDEERVRAREAVDEQVQLMAEQNAEINNTQKALEELANDSSRASNALKKLQDYRATTKAGVNLTQDILTADPKRLTEINKQLAAYNKTITGQATPQEMANVEFRQQAFGGLDMLKSVMPEKIAQQMQARMSRQMLTSMGVDLGQTIAVGPDNQAITLDQALTNVETGRDPQQEAYIEAYRQATERQAAAADRMSDAAIAVANNFQNAASSIIAMATTTTGTTVPPAAAGVPALPQQLPAAVEAAKPEPPKEETPTEPKPSEPLVPPPPADNKELVGLLDKMNTQSAESADKIEKALLAISAALAGAAVATVAQSLLEKTLSKIFDSVISKLTNNTIDAIGKKLFGGGLPGGGGGGASLPGSGTFDVSAAPTGGSGSGVPWYQYSGLGLNQITAPFSGGAGVFGANVGGGAAGAALGTATAAGAAYGGYVVFDALNSIGEFLTNTKGKMDEINQRAAEQVQRNGTVMGYLQNVLQNIKEPGDAAIDLISGTVEIFGSVATAAGQAVGVLEDKTKTLTDRAKAATEQSNQQLYGADTAGGLSALGKEAGWRSIEEQSMAKDAAALNIRLQKAKEIQTSGGSLDDLKKFGIDIPGATSVDDVVARLQRQQEEDKAFRVKTRESQKDYTLDTSTNQDTSAFSGAVSSLESNEAFRNATLRPNTTAANEASVDAQTAQVSAQSITVSSAKPAEPSSPTEVREQTQANAATAPDAIKATEQTASAAQTTADNSDVQAKAAEQATTPGSIYTHDTHVEKVLYEILSVLSGKKAEAPAVQSDSQNLLQQLKKAGVDTKQTIAIGPDNLPISIMNTIVKGLDTIKPDSFGLSKPKQTTVARSPEQQKAIEDKAKADSAFAEKYKKEKPEYAATADEIAAGKSTLEAKSARGEKLSELQQHELEQGRRDEYFRRRNSGETNLDYDQMVYARQQRALDYENRQSQISSGGLRSYSTDPRDLPAQDPNALRIAKNDSRAREWLDKRKPNIPTPQALQPEQAGPTRIQLPKDMKKEEMKKRQAILKRKGAYRVSPNGLPMGRNHEEQDEYMQLQEKTRTPYEQAKLARRQAYLARFRPEVRERMLTKDEKAEARFNSTTTNTGTVPQQQQQIAAYTTSKQANPLEQLTAQFGSFIQNATSMIQSFMSGPVPVTKPQSSATQQQTTTTPNQIVQPLTVDPQATQFLDKLNTAFNSFGSYITSLEKVASNMPSKIDLVLVAEPIEVNVKLTGAAVIEELKRSPEAIKNIVDEQISATVGQKVQQISGWIKSVSGKDFSPGK